MKLFNRSKPEVLTVSSAGMLKSTDTAPPDDVIRIYNKSLAGIGRNANLKLTNVDNGRSIIVRVWGTPDHYDSQPGKVFMHYDQLSELGVTRAGEVNFSGSIASKRDVMNYQAQQGDMNALATKWSIVSAIGAVTATCVSLIGIFI